MARYEIDRRDANVAAGFIGGACVLLSVAFYFLSQAYFDDRIRGGASITDAEIGQVRTSFGLFIFAVGVATALGVRAPRIVGHSLAGLASVLALVGGVVALTNDKINLVLPIALLIAGALFAVLTWKSLERSRPAWAFLVAMCAVFTTIMLFGATKVRTHLDMSLYHAFVVPGLLCVATVSLAMLRREYREST